MTFTLGYKKVNVNINGAVYQLQCHIVDNGLMPCDMVLGADMFNQAMVTITGGVPKITKLTTDPPENDIMVVQPFDYKASMLPCVQEINDERYRKEVIQLIEGYNPASIKQSRIKMELVLEDNIPVYQNPRRLAATERQVVSNMVEDFIKQGIARPSNSPYASPILLRKKKNGTYRFCVDYRNLNEKVVKDRYPLPLMEDVIESLHGYKVYSSIDLRNGFYHVDVEESSVKYTSFITPDGQYEFVKAPFGLCNSPSIFQRYINMVFHEAKQNKLLNLYLDDVMIPATDEEDNLKKLRKVFEIAAENGLIINFEKCKFLQRKITFLGFVIENNTVRPSMEKTKAIELFPQPNNLKAVQSFLGLTGFFRKFIKDYALVARPLTQLLKKDQHFRFGDEQVMAFQDLKQRLCSEPVLRMYNPKAVTELHTDASALGYGGCLFQKQADDGMMHPIYFLSFKTTPAEAKYHSYVLEVLAIMKCLERLRVYVLGIPFTIYTDCEAFQQTMSKKDATAKVARWALALEEYNVEVRHRPGTSMKHVDALSRNFVMIVEEGILSQIRMAQQDDEECQLIRRLLVLGQHKDYTERGGVIYKYAEGDFLLNVPKRMTNEILAKIHGEGHLGRKRMEIIVKQHYDIAETGKKINRFVNNCVTCILATKKAGKKDGWLVPIEKYDTPLHTYHIDHEGPKSYNHLLVVVDAFTKFTWIYPVKTTKCAEAISKLQQQQEIFGNPVRIIADKGSAFKAEEFESYCKERDIHLHLITTATPRGNGQVERMNGVIIPILTKMAMEEPLKWYQHVGRLQRCINSTVSRSTKKTPFELMVGVKMRNQEDFHLNEVIEQELIDEFNRNRVEERQEAKENILKIQQENCRQYNKKRKQARLYTLGELVAIERVQNEKGLKLRTKMLGPYEVTRVLRNNRYEVHKIGSNDGPVNTSTAADRMKPWENGCDSSEDE